MHGRWVEVVVVVVVVVVIWSNFSKIKEKREVASPTPFS
jgi:hypothetical protein